MRMADGNIAMGGARDASSHSMFPGHGSQNCPLPHGSEMSEKWSMAGKFRSGSPTWVVANENLGGNLVEPDKAPLGMAAACLTEWGVEFPSLMAATETLDAWGRAKTVGKK